jgi:signal peptidase II
LIFATVAAVGVTVDLITKAWAFGWLGMPGIEPEWWLVPGVFGFQTSLNMGALFGMGQGQVPVFRVLSVAAALGIVYWVVSGAARDRLLSFALGCVMAGILGNLYDRFGWCGLVWDRPGPFFQPGDPVYAVRDWILVMIGPYHWPNFNIADSMLVVGAGVLLVHAYWFAEPAPK